MKWWDDTTLIGYTLDNVDTMEGVATFRRGNRYIKVDLWTDEITGRGVKAADDKGCWMVDGTWYTHDANGNTIQKGD